MCYAQSTPVHCNPPRVARAQCAPSLESKAGARWVAAMERDEGLGAGNQGLGSRLWGSWCRIRRLSFRIQGSGFWGKGCTVEG